MVIGHELDRGFVYDRVFFSRDPLEQGRHSLLGHLRRKVDCLLFLPLVQSSQIVKKAVQQGSMRCSPLLEEM